MGKYLDQFRPIILIEVLDDEAGARIERLLPSCYTFHRFDDN